MVTVKEPKWALESPGNAKSWRFRSQLCSRCADHWLRNNRGLPRKATVIAMRGGQTDIERLVSCNFTTIHPFDCNIHSIASYGTRALPWVARCVQRSGLFTTAIGKLRWPRSIIHYATVFSFTSPEVGEDRFEQKANRAVPTVYWKPVTFCVLLVLLFRVVVFDLFFHVRFASLFFFFPRDYPNHFG